MGNEFENLRQVTEILSEKPYSSAYICQAARMELFQVYGSPDWFGRFSQACDNATLFELD